VRIEDCGVFTDSTAPTCGSGTVLATTKVKTIGTQSLGTFAAGEKHRYRFDVTLPAATDNSFQGKTASVEFDWNAATN
jgi:hypothetical protein